MGPNLKIKIWGQFVNFKKIEGSNYNFWKFWGANLQFLGSNWNFWNIWDQIENFEKLKQWWTLKFLAFRCNLKFSKFNLNKILHKFSSFWKFFKLLSKQWNSSQGIWIPLKHYIPSKYSPIQTHSKENKKKWVLVLSWEEINSQDEFDSKEKYE